MKTQIITLAALLLVHLTSLTNLTAQSAIPSHLTLQDMTGRVLSANDIIPSDESIIVVFWDSNNPKHMDHLDELNENYINDTDKKQPKIIAISTDKNHIPQKLRSIVAAQAWDFDVYIDVNQAFSRLYAVCDEQLQSYVFHEGRKKTIDIIFPELLPSDFLAIHSVSRPVL